MKDFFGHFKREVQFHILIIILQNVQGVSIKSTFKDFYERLGHIFRKRFWIINYNLYPRQLKKDDILTHIAKKLQACQFSQYSLSEKASSFKKFCLNFFLNFSKAVSEIDLTFKIWVSRSKNDINMDLFFSFFHLKFGARCSSGKQYCENLQACNFFAIWVRILFFCFNWRGHRL